MALIFELHLCGPPGEGQRQLLDRALALLQLDNEMCIRQMLADGVHVPDRVDDLGLRYLPPVEERRLLREQERGDEPNAQENRQIWYGYAAMLERGVFSCGDAAGWEAAVLQAKHGLPAHAYTTGDPAAGAMEGDWHAVYDTQIGRVDPVHRYLTKTQQPPLRPSVATGRYLLPGPGSIRRRQRRGMLG